MDIDDSWKEDMKDDEKYYEFYLSNVSFINITFIYVNRDNEIIFCKSEKIHDIKKGKLNENQLIGLIKKNETLNEKKFTLENLFTYNITLRPNELVHFLQNESETKINLEAQTKYFKNYSTLEKIEFKDTIELFKELNELYFLYKERQTKNNVTKKIYNTYNRNKTTRKKKN